MSETAQRQRKYVDPNLDVKDAYLRVHEVVGEKGNTLEAVVRDVGDRDLVNRTFNTYFSKVIAYRPARGSFTGDQELKYVGLLPPVSRALMAVGLSSWKLGLGRE